MGRARVERISLRDERSQSEGISLENRTVSAAYDWTLGEKSLSLSLSLPLFLVRPLPNRRKRRGGKKGRREKKRKKGKPRRYASYLIETRERESSRYPREDNRSILNKTFLSNDSCHGENQFYREESKTFARKKYIYIFIYIYIECDVSLTVFNEGDGRIRGEGEKKGRH